jgi:hypothetical protein
MKDTLVISAGPDSSTGYVDHDGVPITVDQWFELYRDENYRLINESQVGDHIIRTMWHGIVEPCLGTRPFGTALLSVSDETTVIRELARYSTISEARDGHAALIAKPQEDFFPEA